METSAFGLAHGPAGGKRPLLRAAVSIYGTLAILWLLVPGAVVDWCDDLAEKSPEWAFPLVVAASGGARQIETLSQALHLADLYPLVRARIRPILEP